MSTQPAGLSTGLVEELSGGDGDWRDLPPLKHYTNAFVWNRDSGKILLGMKKRGFGLGLYNGFGGKVEDRETAEEAAMRELQEESGIVARLSPCGILVFANEGQAFTHFIHIFTAHEFEGEPHETDEMRPEWFALPEQYRSNVAKTLDVPSIPFDKMWADDRLWFPLMFSGKKFEGRVDFTTLQKENGETEWIMQRWWFGTEKSAL